MRRTLLLGALLALAAALAMMVGPQESGQREPALRGHRVVRLHARHVLALEVRLGAQRFAARRTESGWDLDGRPADAAAAAALTDLVGALADLRAIDVFRSADQLAFGFAEPRGEIVLVSSRRRCRLVLGAFTAGSTALYARRDGDARVLSIGTLLLSGIERVFFQRSRDEVRAAR